MRALLTLPSIQALGDALGPERVRLVGGCVRDVLLGRPAQDLDLCTTHPPHETLRLVAANPAFTAHPTGLSHGTVTAHHRATATNLEVTTLREDVVSDGRHAQVRFTDDWQADAARRDFTFNALSLDYAGRLYDYFGGEADLRAGTVRFIGDPRARLTEDWLRALRYVRFWGRFSTTAPNPATHAALSAAAPELQRLSVERIWAELKGIGRTRRAPDAVALLGKLGYAAALDLPLQPCPPAQWLTGQSAIAIWAAILPFEGGETLTRLKASRAELGEFAAVQSALASSESVFARQVRYGTAATQSALVLSGQHRANDAPLAEVPALPLGAGDLMALGLEPGPALGAALSDLRERWIASEGQATRDDLIKSIT